MMTAKDAVLHEIEDLPDECVSEVLEYIRRLRLQIAVQRSGTALASEAVLAKDWLRDEEEEAWREL